MIKKSQSPLPKNVKLEHKAKFSFAEAMAFIIAGNKIRREEWSDIEEYCLLKDSFLMIHRNKEGTKEKFHQWVVSEGDLLATDWVVIK